MKSHGKKWTEFSRDDGEICRAHCNETTNNQNAEDNDFTNVGPFAASPIGTDQNRRVKTTGDNCQSVLSHGRRQPDGRTSPDVGIKRGDASAKEGRETKSVKDRGDDRGKPDNPADCKGFC